MQCIRLLLSSIPEGELKVIIVKSLLKGCKQMIWLQSRTERFPKKAVGEGAPVVEENGHKGNLAWHDNNWSYYQVYCIKGSRSH